MALALDLLYRCEPFSWRGLGPGTPVATATRLLEENVLAQFLICRSEDDAPVGLIQAISPNFVHGRAHLTLAVDPASQRCAWPLEGALLFLRYLFVGYPLRRVLVELPEQNWTALARGLARTFSHDCTLEGAEWHRGAHRAVAHYSLDREAFFAHPLVRARAGWSS